jgi:uracil-DNA glycosylase
MPRSLAELAEDGLIDAGWAEALAPVQDVITGLGERLRAEQQAGHGYLPAGEHVLRAFQRPLSDVRVLSDLGIPPAPHGDLTAWSDQGVLLLNRVLTVRPGAAASHRGWGWETVTELAIRTLVARDQPLVAVLWGRDAANLQPMLGATPVIASAHPSPLSASRGFFGSRPFSRANALLGEQGAAPVDWRVDGEAAASLS